MQAITTRYSGPTNTRGSRIIVRAAAGRMMVPYDDDEGGAQGAHHKAVRAFCQKFGWTGELAEGELSDGTHVFVFVSRVEAPTIQCEHCDEPATYAAVSRSDAQKHHACGKHMHALSYPETLIVR